MLKPTWNDLFLHGKKPLFPRVFRVTRGVSVYSVPGRSLSWLQHREIVVGLDFDHPDFWFMRADGRLWTSDVHPKTFMEATEPLYMDET